MVNTEKAKQKRLTLAELASRFDLELRGDGNHEISGVGTLGGADSGDVTFLANSAYREQLGETRAGAVILSEGLAADCPVNCLVADDPYVTYARVAALFDARPVDPPGIHPSAVIGPGAKIGEDVYIGPNAVVAERAEVGPGCSIGAGCYIGPGATLGEGCRLTANVTLMDGVRLGRRVVVHAGAVIGADGFGNAMTDGRWEKVPQLGTVRIGDDCEIGANTAIDRGAIDDTVIEEDVRIDNLVQIAHNVHVGAHTAIAGCSAIAGSARIGRYCLLAGRSGVAGHLEIADRVTITACSMVTKSIDAPGSVWASGVPARPLRAWHRSLAQLDRLGRKPRRRETGPVTNKDKAES